MNFFLRVSPYKDGKILYKDTRSSNSVTVALPPCIASLNRSNSKVLHADVFSLGSLMSHFRPFDKTLENSCCKIFKLSLVHELIIFRWIKE